MYLPQSASPLRALDPGGLPPAVTAWIAAHAGRADAPVSAYLYDPGVAAARAGALRAALPTWAEVFYAVKANGYPPVLDALLQGAGGSPRLSGVEGFEVASAREAAVAVAVAQRAAAPARLIAAGPGKSVPTLRALVQAGVEVVNVESPLELRRLARVATEGGTRVGVAVRVNPAAAPAGLTDAPGTLRMGGTPSAFGVPEADVDDVLALARTLPSVDVVGFHVHAVSHNLDAAAHLAYVAWCLSWSARTAARHRVDLRVVDVGGGLGVPFEPDRLGERPFDLDLFGDGLAGLTPPAGTRVVFEPGRWLVADCGWYAAEITDVKRSYGEVFVVLRGGIHHFQLPVSWEIVHNIAVVPVEDWPAGWPRPVARDEPVTVVGELCTPEDTLVRDVTVGRVRAGDVVVFPMAGSYGWEFAMPEFLGHPRAPRVTLPGTVG